MTRETRLERARRDVAEADGLIGKQELLIVRLRHRGVDATRAAHVLDGMKAARRLAGERLAREEAARRVSLLLQVVPSLAMH